MRAHLRAVDNDAKRATFVVAGVYAIIFLAGLILFVVTGESGLMAGAAALFVLTAGLAGVVAALWKTAMLLFPDREEN